MRHSFVKESIGFNPLLTSRDWTICLAIYGALLLIFLALQWWRPQGMWLAALVGAISGSMPSLLGCLPVRGRVAAERVTGFMARVAQFGFEPAGVTAEGRIYNFKGPRMRRWDSNRIVVRAGADGSLSVTAPVYFYYRLKKLQS